MPQTSPFETQEFAHRRDSYLDVSPDPVDEGPLLLPFLVVPQPEASGPEGVSGGAAEGRGPSAFFLHFVLDHLLYLAACEHEAGRFRGGFGFVTPASTVLYCT